MRTFLLTQFLTPGFGNAEAKFGITKVCRLLSRCGDGTDTRVGNDHTPSLSWSCGLSEGLSAEGLVAGCDFLSMSAGSRDAKHQLRQAPVTANGATNGSPMFRQSL